MQIPRKARDAFSKGTQLLAANQTAASISEFQRALKIFPEFYEAQYKIGLASVNLHRYQDAQAAFEASIEVSKGRYAPSQFGLAIAIMNLLISVTTVWSMSHAAHYSTVIAKGEAQQLRREFPGLLWSSTALAIVAAAFVGQTRLIDNVRLS